MIRVDIRSDRDASKLIGTVSVDSYGQRDAVVTFNLAGEPQWLETDLPQPETLNLTWGNYSPDGTTIIPALKADVNQIDQLRRIPSFTEGTGRGQGTP